MDSGLTRVELAVNNTCKVVSLVLGCFTCSQMIFFSIFDAFCDPVSINEEKISFNVYADDIVTIFASNKGL